jgi:hypothetical protein
MINSIRNNVDTQLKLEAWLHINDPSMSIEEAVRRAEAAGNTVLEVDRENRKLKALETHMPVTEDVWVCEHCGAYSRNKAKIDEHELTCKES